MWDVTPFWLHPLPTFLFSSLLPKWRTCCMSPIKIRNISMGGMKKRDDMENKNLMQFNNSWLASLKTWSYFRLLFSFGNSGYDFKLIIKRHTLNCYSFLLKFLLKTITYKLAVGNCGSSIYCQNNKFRKSYLLFVTLSCSTNKLTSHMLFTCKNFVFSDFTKEKRFFAPEMIFCSIISTDVWKMWFIK